MSTDLRFLEHEPSKGAPILFQNQNLNNTKLWQLFDFLLWRVHQNRQYSLDTWISWIRAIISHGEGFEETFCCASHKFVCGQTIKTGDPIYRCRTCQSDNNTLLCVDCFKHSNHDGHDWFATYTNGSGCCDCGDPLSWDPKGFCTKHPGPSAGDSIKIKHNIEWIARLLCGYIIYIIAHSFDDNYDDVIYLSAYKQCRNSCFFKSFYHNYPLKEAKANNNTNNNANTERSAALTQLMNSPLWGFFNRTGSNELSQIVTALQEEAQMEDGGNDNDDAIEDPHDAKQFEIALKDIANIENDYKAFEAMQHDSKTNDRYLCITAKTDELRETKWDAPKDIIKAVLDCNSEEAMEMSWKLRMYNTAIIAVGDEESISKLQEEWMTRDEEKQYQVEMKSVTNDYCRVVSKGLLLSLIEEISNWCNDSEILKRFIGSAMILNIGRLSANCDGLKPKGTLKIEIPPWNDTDNDNDNDEDIDMDMERKIDNECIVRESETAFYFFILHDHVLRKQYLPFLSNFWYPLITLPPVKHRVSQCLSTVYQVLCTTYGEIKRTSRHQFLGLTVQFMTIDPIAQVCESHDLLRIVLDSYLKLTCRKYCIDMEGLDIDGMALFKGSEELYKTDWEIATKPGANHIIFDQRYLMSVDVMMEYVVFNKHNGGLEAFWKRYIMMVSVIQNSLCTYRRHIEHIEYEDRKIISYLRFELNMFFSNQRVILNGLYQCIIRHKTKGNKNKYESALRLLIDMIHYGLTLIHKAKYSDIVWHDETENVGDIRMKLSNFDGGYVEHFNYFRTDRDRVSLVLPLSRFIMNLSALYTEITTESFGQLMHKLEVNAHVRNWIDYSLRFITVFDEFHADLWIKNGDTFRTTIYNYKRSDFSYIFYGAHFSMLQSFATQIMPCSNLLTLILHRYCLHDWFALNKVELFGNTSINEDITSYVHTGWKHWGDARRTLKMVTYVLHTIIAMISEPHYCLLLDDVQDDDLRKKYNDMIKYELIQWLVLSPTSMTELASKIYVHVDSEPNKEEKLRIILNQIAIYHAPKTMEDTGKFVLKSEYYAQFNPFFKKYDRFNPGFIQSSSDEQSEATEKYLKFMANSSKKNVDDIMFPNWPKQLISYSNDYQLSLLSAPYMGLIWNCTLYHLYMNDTTRYTIDHVQQCLRLISMGVQVLVDSRWDLQSEKSMKLLQNLTQCFNFRLSNTFDHITDDNKDALLTSKTEENNTDDDDDDEYLISSKESKYNLIEIHQQNEDNVEGIGSVLWILCKIFMNKVPSTTCTHNDNDDTDYKMAQQPQQKALDHIPLSQRLLIEEIIMKLYSLKIQGIMDVMHPIWPQPDGLEKSFSIVSDTNDKNPKGTLTPTQKRKKKRGKKAQRKMLAKMKKKKEKFAQKHQTSIIKDEMEEASEQKQRNESFGIGVDRYCIVCKSKDNQDTMFMMGFVKNCSLLHRCVDNKGSIHCDVDYAKEEYLPTRKGLNFSFCGHFVHKQCYDTFIINKVRSHHRHEHYYGRGTLSIDHFEYACPYCKTVANVTVPLSKVYRNPHLSADRFETVLDITKKTDDNGSRIRMSDINNEINHSYDQVFGSVLCRASSNAFLTKLFWIYDNYSHESHDGDSDKQYLDDLGIDNVSFVYANSVSYTISWFEIMFRSYSEQQRRDKLTRSISLMNTFISVAWSRCQHSGFKYLDVSLLFKNSWDFIHKYVLNDNDEDDEEKVSSDDEQFEDPFIRLICGILSHPSTFLFDKNSSIYDTKKQTTLDFYQLILSCYIMKLTQLLLSFVMRKSNDNMNGKEMIAKVLNTKEINSELNCKLYDWMTAFLRKSLIVYNAFFNKNIDSLLSVLWLNDNVKECDLICDVLHLPTIMDIVPQCWEDEYFKNYLSVINIRYVSRLKTNVDTCASSFALITLPNDYNTLFRIAAETKCSKKGIAAIKSGVCLLCGKVICIDCCTNSVVDHCQECNDGIGVILYFQKSSIILMWNHYGTQYESVFLDKYGECDRGLWRGVQLKFNQQRYDELTQLLVQHLIPNKMTQIRKSNKDLLEMRLQL